MVLNASVFFRTYVRENPYALPDEKYESFLHDIERDFGLRLDTDAPEEQQLPAMTRVCSRLRFSDTVQVEEIDASPSPLCTSYSPLPHSSSCSSASSSSSGSPQTPHTPLSPVSSFHPSLHLQETESKTGPVVAADVVVVEHLVAIASQ